MQIRTIFATLLPVALAGVGVASLSAHVARSDNADRSSYAVFARDVAPILADSCSSRDKKGNYVCHGRASGQFDADGKLAGDMGARLPHVVPPTSGSCDLCHSHAGPMRFSFALGPTGKIDSERRVQLAFDQTRQVFGKLLRMPLSAQAGGLGLFHPGGEIFESTSDASLQKLADWVALERRNLNKPTQPVSAAEKAFGDDVLPILAHRTCLAAGCHTFNHSSFVPDPGTATNDLALPITQRFSPDQIAYNRTTAKGLIQSLVYLTGDVEESRFLKKIIPVSSGGLLHRGGNQQFVAGKDDPDYAKIVHWLNLEREEKAGKLKSEGKPIAVADLGKVRGVLFVRTPRDSARRYLDVGKYLPGSDLFLVKVAEGETLQTARATPVNLTAQFHVGQDADVREPDVRFDGKAVLFSMRVGQSDSLNVYQIRLDDHLDYVAGSLQRLTYGPAQVNGMQVHFTDPMYVPDPTDTAAGEGGINLDRADVVFASNLSGRVVQSSDREIIGQADGGDVDTVLDADRTEVPKSFAGRRIHFLAGPNKGQWRRIVTHENLAGTGTGDGARFRLDKPLAKDVDATTVYAIERDAAQQPDFLPGYSVYGMKLPEPGAERNLYAETLTRITWNLGQELDLSLRSTGEVFFASQRSGVDKDGKPVFHMASCRRHLDTRFSFPTHQGNRSLTPIYADNSEMPGGIDIHVGMAADNVWQGGNLIVTDHQFGPDLEAKNPNLPTAGVFDAHGVPRATQGDLSNLRWRFEHGAPSMPRFVFKTLLLLPNRGAEAVNWTGLSPGGIYRDPTPLPDGSMLVSYAPGPIDNLDPAARPNFELAVLRPNESWHAESGKGVPQVQRLPLPAMASEAWSEVQAVAIYTRIKPKINAGNRPKSEHIIAYPGVPKDTRPATYLEKNYLLIDAIMRDPSPFGKHPTWEHDPVTGATNAPWQRVTGVRFVEALPIEPEQAGPLDLTQVRNGDPQSTLISNGISPMKRIVGEIPLQPDGSIMAKVPSMVPMILQSLGPDGMALRQEARYFFFAPNETFGVSPSSSETFRTCGACMGSISGKAADLFGPILPYSGSGGVQAITAAHGSPPELGLKVAERKSIDFVADVQPILDRHCVSCHTGSRAAANLDLSATPTRYYNTAYESLMQLADPESGWFGAKKYVSERGALAIESYLIAKVFGQQFAAERPLTGDMPHPSAALFQQTGLANAVLTDEERHVLALWIDLGATFHGAPPAAVATGGAP